MTLTDFLLARIAEDEAVAGAVPSPVAAAGKLETLTGRARAKYIAAWQPARVLAECAAKRAIVGLHELVPSDEWDAYQSGQWGHTRIPGRVGCNICDDAYGDGTSVRGSDGCDTLRALAGPYSSHPEFEASWRS